MLKIRQSWDRLILNMGIPMLVRWHLYIETGPRWPHKHFIFKGCILIYGTRSLHRYRPRSIMMFKHVKGRWRTCNLFRSVRRSSVYSEISGARCQSRPFEMKNNTSMQYSMSVTNLEWLPITNASWSRMEALFIYLKKYDLDTMSSWYTD